MDRRLSPRDLLNLAKSLFETNEELPLILGGGLAAQEVYASRRIRPTSDIDVFTLSRNDAREFVRRMGENGYEVFYNPTLDKYSVFKHEKGIHIDVYPEKVGIYSLSGVRVLERRGIRVVSPEDLIGIKIYAYLLAEKGRLKHLVDIYAILIGKEELSIEYLLEKVLPYVSKVTYTSVKEILERISPQKNENALQQFMRKERRFINEEYQRIYQEYVERFRGNSHFTTND